jgi:XRE family transcriptional regulator, aerobic/anaerobic benzoate catabolism transcriptional regulator
MSSSPPTELLARVGGRVRAVREQHRLTQSALAKRSGVSLRFLADVERGAANPSLLRMAELAAALGVSLADLVATAGPVEDAVARFAQLGPEQRADRMGRPPQALVLVGMRGAGKSTVGQAVASRLGAPFHEVDQLVEARAMMPLGTLFSEHGAERYHALESAVVEELLGAGGRVVLAAGGSLVTQLELWSHVRRHAQTVWLRARPESHLRRVEAQGDTRPTRGRGDALLELRALLLAREASYSQADLTLDTDRLDRLETVWAVLGWLGERSAADLD